MNKSRILITGGAGFIGSNLVEDLINDDRVDLIRILDNLSTGSLNNIEPFLNSSKVEFINGDITDYSTCLKACDKIDKILHQAALGSVPRSVNDPFTQHMLIYWGLQMFILQLLNVMLKELFQLLALVLMVIVSLPKKKISLEIH